MGFAKSIFYDEKIYEISFEKHDIFSHFPETALHINSNAKTYVIYFGEFQSTIYRFILTKAISNVFICKSLRRGTLCPPQLFLDLLHVKIKLTRVHINRTETDNAHIVATHSDRISQSEIGHSKRITQSTWERHASLGKETK